MNWLEHIIYEGAQSSLDWNNLKIVGSDAAEFLNGQLTSDVSQLKKNQGHLSCAVDIKGKVIAFFFLIKREEDYLVLCPKDLVSKLKQRLEQYIIMEDVTIIEDTQTFDINNIPDKMGYQIELAGEKLTITENKKIQATNVQFMDYLNLVGLPLDRIEKISDCMLNETSLIELATSFTKGCYLGQEIVSKIHNNRGAAYAEVILISESEFQLAEFQLNDRKAGKILRCFKIKDQYYALASLFRDFKVDSRECQLSFNHGVQQVKIKLFPYFKRTPKEKAVELYDRAIQSFTQQDLSDEAVHLLQLALKHDPSYADAYEALAVIFGRSQRFEEAISLLKTLEKIDPNSVMVHTNLSLFYMKQGKITEAEDEKAKATVKTFAKFGSEAEEKRKLEKIQKHKTEESLHREGMFKQVLEIDPDDTMALSGLAEIFLERQQFQAAKESYIKVIKMDAKYSSAYLGLAKCLVQLKEYSSAREICNAGINIAAAKGDLNSANQMQNLLNTISVKA